jgi:hypothetical protein
VILSDGRAVLAVTLRRLPEVEGIATMLKGNDRLDILAQQKYQDPTKFWHIADANSEMQANDLTKPAGPDISLINLPEI